MSHPTDQIEFGKSKLKSLKRRLRKNPRAFEPNLRLGEYYLQRGDIPAAIEHLEAASAARPEQAKLHFVLANAYRAVDDFARSEEYFRKALEIDPQNLEYLYNYGVLLQAAGRTADAIGIFEKVAEQQAQNFELMNDIGALYFLQKDFSDAIKALEKSIAINRNYTVAQINLAYVYMELNEWQSCQNLVDSLTAAYPSDPEVQELARQLQTARENEAAEEELHTELSFSEQLFQITPLKIISDFGERDERKGVALSIVIPVLNEVENIDLLYRELLEVLTSLKEDWEIIFIDDGSTDGTVEVIESLCERDPAVRLIQFRRNYGQTAAMVAGFKYARGGVVITMDGDLQNDPKDIPRLLEKMSEGYDLVSGWRKERKDKWLTRKLPSMIANKFINKLIAGTGVQLNDYGCTLKAYKSGIIKNIHLYGEMHRFIPAFAAWLGVKVAEIPANHRPRTRGQAKYNLSRVTRVIFDLIVVRFFSDYLTTPIQFFGKIAMKIVGFGSAALLLLTLLSHWFWEPITLNTLLILLGILTFGGFQILSMGVLGEIMIRSYFEGQKKDYYVVERILNDGRDD